MRQGLIALVAVLAACASNVPPPGGPEDKVPPKLIRVTPDTNAVNVKDDAVSFYFDETINDRGTGAQEVDSHFLVSPSDGAPRVSWHRSRIDVRPRRAFRPNTAYTVTLLPGLTDLRNNIMKGGATIVFSTGPTIPTHRITGIAFDWASERQAPLAYIEAVSPDSVTYLAQTDTLGKFIVGPLSPGSYLLRVIIDQNTNRALDRNEAFDTLRVTVPQAAPAELLAVVRDTLPTTILTVESPDSVTLKVTFARNIDPTQPLTADKFRLLGPDSLPVPILAALSPQAARDADVARAKVLSDSVRRADSLAGKALMPVPAPVVPRPAANAPPPPPKPSLPPPFTVVTLNLGRPLPRNTSFRLKVAGIRALSGREVPSERSFTTPKPLPPRPAPDSARAAPAATPPARPPVTPPRR